MLEQHSIICCRYKFDSSLKTLRLILHNFQDLPRSMNSSFSITRVTEKKCSAGCDVTRKEEPRVMVYWNPSADGELSHIGSLEAHEITTATCKRCKSPAQRTVMQTVTDEVQNILINRSIDGPETNQRFVSPDIDSIITLFGKNWRIKG